jgi:ribonuclease P protein component
MFPRKKRLARSDFSGSGFLRGTKRVGTHLSVLFPQEKNGYAVIISKKTVRSSVKRHLLKRRILAILTKASSLPPSIVVYPREKALHLRHTELSQELLELVSGKAHSR